MGIMCRLFAAIGSGKVEATWLRQFRKMAEVGITKTPGAGHRDGWGIVFYDKGTAAYLGREPSDASGDKKYEIATHAMESGAIGSPIYIAHVRRATKGMELTVKNTHPFIYKNWAFGHNGEIYGFAPQLQFPMEGTTDSETLFRYLLGPLTRNLEKDPEFILKDSIKDAKAMMKGYTAMNFTMSDSKSIYAYRDFAKPEEEKYYGLKYYKGPNAVVVCSEPLAATLREADWEDIKNGHLMVVHDDLEVKFVQV